MTNYSAEEKSYIWLDAFPLSTREKNALLEAAGSATFLVKRFAEISKKTIKDEKTGVYKDMADSLKDDVFFKNLLSSYESKGIKAITRVSDGFFPEWKTADNPPLVQYEKGNEKLKEKSRFAIVGSRRTPPEAMKRTKEIAKRLSDVFAVTTGCADGGDDAAKCGAEENGGAIVILPGGFASIESAKCDFSKNLYVTERSFAMPALKFSYERRNYLLAEACKAALVVSAGEKSGALITAKYVKEKGKPLFAFPYSIEATAGRGCNALLKNGAFLAETAEDILKKLGVSPASYEKRGEGKAENAVLSPTEQIVYEALQATGKANVNVLAKETGLPAWKISGTITALEIKGLLTRTGGNCVSVV